ncbi:hypothetical protein J6590_041094 [Homalodisca vitripennis]|nr:hypothetical protein J6590_041094 [Homalodisca vitripennis]
MRHHMRMRTDTLMLHQTQEKDLMRKNAEELLPVWLSTARGNSPFTHMFSFFIYLTARFSLLKLEGLSWIMLDTESERNEAQNRVEFPK